MVKIIYKIILGVIKKKDFIGLLSICTIKGFVESLVSDSKGIIKCLTLNNRPCEARPTFVNVNSGETLFHPFTVSVNKCGGRCNFISDPYAQVSVPNKVKKHECESI